jgi:hypothetical protein
MDQYNIKVDNSEKDADSEKTEKMSSLSQINMIVPEGMRSPLAFDTSIQGRLCVGPGFNVC